MKIIFLSLSIILLALSLIIVLKINKLRNIEYQQREFLKDKKILTVYFSNGGNTKNIAENINSIVKGDIIQIKLKENYPKNIFKMSKIVREQMKTGYFPETEAIDISDYDVVFIGSPVWGFSLSLPIKAFLKNNNFENKTLIPFITYSGGANKEKLIKEINTLAKAKEINTLAKAKEIKKPLLIFENGIFYTKEQVIEWLNDI